MPEIYLDHNATTPLDPEVREAMQPYLGERYGNPSCAHRKGQESRKAIEEARAFVAEYFGCARDEVIFTAGGTEANNLAIKGTAFMRQDRGRHILIGGIEHPSVKNTAHSLERFGFEVTTVAPDETGQIPPDAFSEAVRPDTILCSIMHVQNELGTINPMDAYAELLVGRTPVLHSDAAQSVCKIPTGFPSMGAGILTFAAHKFYGPKGVGAAILRRGVKLYPLLHGAGHENGRRAGTENTAAIVGLAAALRIGRSRIVDRGERTVALRDALLILLGDELPGVVLNGHVFDRLPNTLNVSFLGVKGSDIAERVPDLLLATRQACSDREEEASPTFLACGLGPERSSSALRISLGEQNTWDEIQTAAEQLIPAVKSLRAAAGTDVQSLPASSRPRCPRCELHDLRLELTMIAPAVVCDRHPTCRYEKYLAAPAGATT